MRGNRSFLAICLAIATTFGLIAYLPATAAAKERPFMARVEGNAHLTPTPDPLIIRNDETGEGEATHLGHFLWEDVEFVDFSQFPVQLSVVGTFTMTAANDDELHGSLTTTAIPDFAAGILEIEGEFTFNGGTGRFADAIGGGILTAIASILGDLPFEGSFTGTISY